jgi:hypothetical protein
MILYRIYNKKREKEYIGIEFGKKFVEDKIFNKHRTEKINEELHKDLNTMPHHVFDIKVLNKSKNSKTIEKLEENYVENSENCYNTGDSLIKNIFNINRDAKR